MRPSGLWAHPRAGGEDLLLSDGRCRPPRTSGDPAARVARGVVARRALSDRFAAEFAGSERMVAGCLTAGVLEIAAELAMPVSAVGTHMRQDCGKLGAHRRSEAAGAARALCLLAPSARRPWASGGPGAPRPAGAP